MSRRPKTALLVGVAVVLLAAGCGDAGESSEVPETTTTTTTVAAEPATVTSPPVSTVPPRDFSAVTPIVQDFVDEHALDGAGLVVVHVDDGIVHEEYWGDFDADRVSLIASSSKMITAGVLLHLQDRGLLDIEAPVAAAVPWGDANPAITPAHLLSNSSGLVGLLPNPGYAPYACQYSPTGTLQDCGEAIFTTAGDDGDIVGPGTAFRYGGGQWQVAGAIAEAVSGQPWADLIDEIYGEPCGLEATGYGNPLGAFPVFDLSYPDHFLGDPSNLVPTANPNMEAGAYTTTGDYAELLLMHLRGGVCGDERVLSEASVEVLHTDRTDPVYAMGWWVDRSTGRLTDAGAFGAVPWLDLDDGYGAYLVIEADSVLGDRLAQVLFEPVEAAVVG